MDEDYYALSKLARTVFGTNDLDHRRDEGAGSAEGSVASIASRDEAVTYSDVEHAKVILVAGLDAEQEVPILHLRLRKAARRGARIHVLHPRRTRLYDVAEHILCRPGEEASFLVQRRPDVVDALRNAGTGAVVIAGPRLADTPNGVWSLAEIAGDTSSRFAYVTRRANDRGALVAGVHPSLLPGGREFGVPRERSEVESLWGPIIVGEDGRSWRGILQACADREIDVLFLVGVDPLRDYPDAALTTRALQNVERTVVQSLELGSLEPYADAFLPAAAFLEKDGHVTTWEGRSQRIASIRGAAGIALPDWEIFASLALASGGDLGFETLDELHEEMGRLLAPHERGEGHVVDTGATRGPAGDGELLLFTYPLLVDEGRLSERSDELKAALEDEPFLEINPSDAAERGVTDGERARVRTAAGEAELTARVTDHVVEGAVFVPFNQPGFAANTILTGSFTVLAAVEAVEAAVGTDRARGEPVEAVAKGDG
jgi:NADH-quinone oxidoreductase subunit G